jgi:SAM-dependent methyltransferase
MPQEHYTFGDNDYAAQRLALLACVYEPTSRRLLAELPPADRGAAVDLGCGPGFTTALLDEVLAPAATWGLDASPAFVERARARLGARISFAVHDVTAAPLPTPPADVLYCRHLLVHLAAPSAALAAWATAARPGARLVLEEGASLASSDPIFTSYYEHVRALQSHYGQDTFVGRALDRLAAGTPWKVERFARVPVALDAQPMARLHAMNLRTWSADPFARAAFDARALEALGGALDRIASGDRPAPPVDSELGQAVLVR